MVLAEKALGVTQEQDFAVTLHPVHLAPGAHDPRVVEADDGNQINAFLDESLQIGENWWDVVGLAARSEGTRDGDDHHLLALELLGGIESLRKTAGRRVRVGNGHPPTRLSAQLYETGQAVR
ncbi:hypothetical protein Tdes44962_MAKER00142 [Teratosphaeria destructans]|uniref:Uncharacterized protein n=1 Tax=Teratosphaeria destructans TaxID=418781 RepID=A0A9W7W8E3_9PEZI|nr:hypothetical protein Tdes44962_MAKER00142 [Teratosphaeria destructans]